jgi:hypothetical protein
MVQQFNQLSVRLDLLGGRLTLEELEGELPAVEVEDDAWAEVTHFRDFRHQLLTGVNCRFMDRRDEGILDNVPIVAERFGNKCLAAVNQIDQVSHKQKIRVDVVGCTSLGSFC